MQFIGCSLEFHPLGEAFGSDILYGSGLLLLVFDEDQYVGDEPLGDCVQLPLGRDKVHK